LLLVINTCIAGNIHLNNYAINTYICIFKWVKNPNGLPYEASTKSLRRFNYSETDLTKKALKLLYRKGCLIYFHQQEVEKVDF